MDFDLSRGSWKKYRTNTAVSTKSRNTGYSSGSFHAISESSSLSCAISYSSCAFYSNVPLQSKIPNIVNRSIEISSWVFMKKDAALPNSNSFSSWLPLVIRSYSFSYFLGHLCVTVSLVVSRSWSSPSKISAKSSFWMHLKPSLACYCNLWISINSCIPISDSPSTAS